MLANRLGWSVYCAYHLSGQAGFPFRRFEAIERVQARRVGNIMSHAYRTVPYYRETMDKLGLRPWDFQNAGDLAKLPLIERCQLQRDPEYFVSRTAPLDSYLRLRSGGSTGAPCTVFHDSAALFQNAAHGERERALIRTVVGRSFGYREAVIGARLSTAQEVQEHCQKNALFPRRIRIQRQYLFMLEPPERVTELLNQFEPDIIHSTFGSYLEILFPYLYRTRVPFHRPKLITYSSTGLSASVRRLINEKFGVPVLSTYQAVEAFKIGFECDRGLGLHVNIDIYPVRIIGANGATLAAGQTGEVVVSNLVNRATVLLNYRLGDIAQTMNEACPCGRQLPLISFPLGRSDDLIRLASGRILHPQHLRLMFTNEDEIWQYQVVQESRSRFRVLVVAAESCDRPTTERRLLAKFTDALGGDNEVEIRFVDSLARSEAKLRTVVSLCPGPEIQYPSDSERE